MLFDSAMESINRNERIIQVLKRLKLDPDHPPADFTGVYQYALVEYGVGKPRPALAIFRQKEIQDLFREALERNNPSILLKNGEAFLADSPLQADLQASNVDVRREFYEFAAIFIEVAKRTRTPAEILAEQKLESLHRQLGGLQERLNRLPTIEGLRTEMARLSAQSPLALPGGAEPETFSAEQCKAFALAQQMRGWFETLGFRFETHEVWQDDYFEWIINIPVRRGRYDRILVRGIDGEAGLSAVEDLKQAVATHRTDEGWLVTARRISRAARDEVEKAENEGLGCYTLDELLDQDADFNSYLTWLETEIQQRGIDQKYVPLACLKEEIDPDTQQRLGVSRYGDRDGWIDGYIDLWLDDPAKEHISVLGEFGTGKTWFALHYAWKALQRYREAQRRGLERPRLPLVIPLRDYAKAVSVESLFSEFFFRKHEIPIPGYSAFEQLNRMGKLLLIFDGFDEMAARVDRQEMINNFWELAKVVVPGAKVILTCRTEHFPDAKEGRALLNAELQASTRDLTGETPQFEVLELEKFNDEQIRQVLAHQAQPATVAQIMGNPQLLDLARRPVLTELILEALPDIEAGKPVDMSRVYLYAVRHKMERDIKAERTFTSMADKLYFMCELSWEMLSTDRMSINYREFPDRIRKLFGPAVQEEKDLDHWHYDMMGQTMLIRNADGDYTPAHRSLLEFFVAYKFAAELGILAPEFHTAMQLLKSQTSLPNNAIDNFTWSSFFRFRTIKAKSEFVSSNVEKFESESIEKLCRTVGKKPFSRAVIELLVPLLEKCTETELKLLEVIKQTCSLQVEEVQYLGGNVV
ncbi:MAG: NACHT domain-containing protein, partial [Cyanobacteria bacterium]|nr:NACHT domain-containing protein [Cyanobacteriota bacterium]